MAKAIPDRWNDYTAIGEVVRGTRFIPFKVPLRQSTAKQAIRKDERLDDQILCKKIPKLGLIIDLTNTNRYYDLVTFLNKGILYKKIMVQGHETPHKHLREKFVKAVNKFINYNKNNNKLIGVHCTHGVNRTGFMICYYMITQMRMEPKVALSRFAQARGYEIERKNYILELQNPDLVPSQNWRDRNWRENRIESKKDQKTRPNYI